MYESPEIKKMNIQKLTSMNLQRLKNKYPEVNKYKSPEIKEINIQKLTIMNLQR